MSSTEQSAAAHWTPLIHLGHETWVGLASGALFVGDLMGPKREVDPEEPIGLLPFLERPYSVVVADLREREAQLSLPSGSLTELVPLGAIPRTAVAMKSEYWADRALSWLAEIPRTEANLSPLQDMKNANWASQGLRHRAKRLQLERLPDRG